MIRILFILVVSICMLCSACKKKNVELLDYLEVKIADKTYRNDIYHSGTGYSGQTGCVPKPHFLAYLSSFETSTFSFDGNISYFENEVDFKNAVKGNYTVQSETNSSICNLNLAVSYTDKTLSNSYCTVLPGGLNQVTEIVNVGPTSTGSKYRIKGNFSCTIRNSAGAIIPVIGNYQYTAVVYK